VADPIFVTIAGWIMEIRINGPDKRNALRRW